MQRSASSTGSVGSEASAASNNLGSGEGFVVNAPKGKGGAGFGDGKARDAARDEVLPADGVGVREALFADDPEKTSCISVGDTLVGMAGAGAGVGGGA